MPHGRAQETLEDFAVSEYVGITEMPNRMICSQHVGHSWIWQKRPDVSCVSDHCWHNAKQF